MAESEEEIRALGISFGAGVFARQRVCIAPLPRRLAHLGQPNQHFLFTQRDCQHLDVSILTLPSPSQMLCSCFSSLLCVSLMSSWCQFHPLFAYVCTCGPEEALQNESPRVISVFIAAQFLRRTWRGRVFLSAIINYMIPLLHSSMSHHVTAFWYIRSRTLQSSVLKFSDNLEVVRIISHAVSEFSTFDLHIWLI